MSSIRLFKKVLLFKTSFSSGNSFTSTGTSNPVLSRISLAIIFFQFSNFCFFELKNHIATLNTGLNIFKPTGLIHFFQCIHLYHLITHYINTPQNGNVCVEVIIIFYPIIETPFKSVVSTSLI